MRPRHLCKKVACSSPAILDDACHSHWLANALTLLLCCLRASLLHSLQLQPSTHSLASHAAASDKSSEELQELKGELAKIQESMTDLKKVMRHMLTGTCLLALSESTPTGLNPSFMAIWLRESPCTQQHHPVLPLTCSLNCRTSMLSWATQ